MHLLFSQLLSRETKRPLVVKYRPKADSRDRGYNSEIEFCCVCKSLGLVEKAICEQGCPVSDALMILSNISLADKPVNVLLCSHDFHAHQLGFLKKEGI